MKTLSPTDLRAYNIPDHMWSAIDNYFTHHIQPGEFLSAVLKNDLREACLKADDTNILHLRDYVSFLWNIAPLGSWGSPQEFNEWISKRQC